VRKTAPELFRYPDGGAYYLGHKLADKLGFRPEQLMFGAGSNEILEFIAHCFMGPGRSVVASQHAFVVYRLLSHMFGTDFIEVPARDLGHDLTAMRKAIRDDTSVVFVCNPNNPTGTLCRQAGIMRFVRAVPEDVLIVFDEAYAEICLSRMPRTLELIDQHPNCLVLRTFSKGYGLAGLRIGYGVGPEPVIEALQKARQPFNVNRAAQEAAFAALDDDAFLRRTRRIMRLGRAFLETACDEMGLEYQPTVTNFMLIKVGKGAEVARELMRRGVIVRPVDGYGLAEYIRINFGTMPENERLVTALREVMASRS
jgi:histidinol-phosphate aminotransferase